MATRNILFQTLKGRDLFKVSISLECEALNSFIYYLEKLHLITHLTAEYLKNSTYSEPFVYVLSNEWVERVEEIKQEAIRLGLSVM